MRKRCKATTEDEWVGTVRCQVRGDHDYHDAKVYTGNWLRPFLSHFTWPNRER